ncbi:winged helix-turn-helix domain-containing protein [Hamadaea tsunoensis]|uniref:winged helix-turn-helix domain-containing protein n=1 Tax=Hamadaea tsunoensis TaxID=53368 RepID=UPI0012F7A1A1|nr:helix-turn-helix domain-containing protein [Hamadaea tsunoensis]
MTEFREHTDPQALRAMAHPLRLRLLEELALRGPLTATELADRLGDSAPNCSWHLRQLAKYGYIEEAPGGVGRQRPWRAVARGNRWGARTDAPELARAGDETEAYLVDREVGELSGWRERKRREPAAWQDAAFLSQSLVWATDEELEAIGKEIKDIVFRHLDRMAEPRLRPPTARPVRLVAWGVPTE